MVTVFNFTVFPVEIPILANRVDPDQMPRLAASELRLHCLHTCIMSTKRQSGQKELEQNYRRRTQALKHEVWL